MSFSESSGDFVDQLCYYIIYFEDEAGPLFYRDIIFRLVAWRMLHGNLEQWDMIIDHMRRWRPRIFTPDFISKLPLCLPD